MVFQGELLTAVCAALAPAGWMCVRAWALLMSALHQQSCAVAAAAQWLALPGRCAMLVPALGRCLGPMAACVELAVHDVVAKS